MNQSRECSAIGPGDREPAEENEPTADDRSGPPMAPLLLKAGQVAQLLGLGRSTVFALLAAGELPVIRIGRSVRVPRVALEGWIDERTDHAANRATSEDRSSRTSVIGVPSMIVTAGLPRPPCPGLDEWLRADKTIHSRRPGRRTLRFTGRRVATQGRSRPSAVLWPAQASPAPIR